MSDQHENQDQLACIYASLILADDDVTVTAEKISTILKAANIDVENIWPSLFAKALGGTNLRELIANSVLCGAPSAAPVAAGTTAAAGDKGGDAKADTKAQQQDDDDDDSDDDMGFGLFD